MTLILAAILAFTMTLIRFGVYQAQRSTGERR